MPRILFPAHLDQAVTAMAFLHEHLNQEHENLLGFVELAVEELLVNVISYAYPDTLPSIPEAAAKAGERAEEGFGMVELGFRWVSMDDTPYICIWIRDWGVPFDPFMNAPAPDTSLDVDERPIGGLGVHLVKNVSTHHCYSGSDGANTIELYFKDQD